MGRHSTLQISESVEELKKLKLQQPNLKSEKRIECLLLLKEERFSTQGELADYLGVCRQNMVKWLTVYRKSGIIAMLPRGTRNRSSKIFTPEIHQGLQAKMLDTTSPLLGYWDAQRWVLDTYGVEVNYFWLRKYLIKHFKTKLKTPRKSHIKKDGKAVEAFLKTANIH